MGCKNCKCCNLNDENDTSNWSDAESDTETHTPVSCDKITQKMNAKNLVTTNCTI